MSDGDESNKSIPRNHDDRGRFAKGNNATRATATPTRRLRLHRTFIRYLLDALEGYGVLEDSDPLIKAVAYKWAKAAEDSPQERQKLVDFVFGKSANSEVLATIEKLGGQVKQIAQKVGRSQQ